MKSAEKRDELIASCGISSQLDRGFDGFGSGISEVDASFDAARREGSQLLRQLHHVFVIKIRAGHVDQARSLVLYGLHNFGMAVARRYHGNTGIEIQKAIAVNVLDNRAFSAPT